MSINAAADFNDVWTAIFRRKGADGEHTKLYESCTLEVKREIVSAASLRNGEIIVVVSFYERNRWSAITTERLISFNNPTTFELSLRSICDATVNINDLARGPQSKVSLSEIKIISFNYDEYFIGVDPQTPLIDLLHILKNIGTRNRKMQG